jgi:hypothetical protein
VVDAAVHVHGRARAVARDDLRRDEAQRRRRRRVAAGGGGRRRGSRGGRRGEREDAVARGHSARV